MKWKPAASLQVLQLRAQLLRTVRRYFDDAAVMEVVTPVLSGCGTTDPSIESLVTDLEGNRAASKRHYLHTSPEFPMKRLLCAYSCDIYQICTVFRQGESGRHHNPEFQMLEYYRVGFDHHQLMQDVECLISELWRVFKPTASVPQFHRVSYREALNNATGCSLEALDAVRIAQLLQQHNIDSPLQLEDDLDAWLDLLMATVVGKSFDPLGMTFLYDYPVSQASLARVQADNGGHMAAARFELYAGELELANGFFELKDATEQRARFETDQQQRRQNAQTSVPFDHFLVDALEAGLPDCAGVAIGLDRLLMVLSGEATLADVLAFPVDVA